MSAWERFLEFLRLLVSGLSHIFMDTLINTDVMFLSEFYCITLKARSLIE